MSSPQTATNEILVNGEAYELPAERGLVALLDALGLTGKRVAVARNRAIVPRSQYSDCRLEVGDRIEILEAVGGG